eukprot:1986997-Pleurochrysis_carterae.AAC.1
MRLGSTGVISFTRRNGSSSRRRRRKRHKGSSCGSKRGEKKTQDDFERPRKRGKPKQRGNSS